MGQMYEIGLQAGKEVAVKVDALIASLHHGDKCGENFDPIKRMVLSDGSKAYRWYQKWNPFLYSDQQRLVDTVKQFNDDEIGKILDNISNMLNDSDVDDNFDDDVEKKADLAYKLVCVGDEGGIDEYSNEFGADLFDGLYDGSALVMPQEFTESEDQRGAMNVLNELIKTDYDREVSCQTLAEMMDDVDLWQSFEDLAVAYTHGNNDVKKGLDIALSCILSKNMKEVAEKVMEVVNAAD